MFSLDAASIATAVEQVLSSPEISSHVAKMAGILATRKESPAKVGLFLPTRKVTSVYSIERNNVEFL
jgi:hypothetical protein